MQPGSSPPVASDGDEDKEHLMTLSITELISNLRTAFRMIDYDRVEEVLIEKENKLKGVIKLLTEKLELETLARMGAEEECKERLKERYETVKKNDEMDYEDTIAKLRIKNTKLEEEKRVAESMAELWKRKLEELSDRLMIIGKGVNSSVNGDTRVGIIGKAEELSSIRGNTDPGVSDKVMGKMDMNVVDIFGNEGGNTPARSSPSQRKDLKSGNAPVSATEVTRQSVDSPNKGLLGASGVSADDMNEQENNEVDIDGHQCAADTSPSKRKIEDYVNAHLPVDNDARRSPDTPNIAAPSEETTKNAVDIHDDECRTNTADISPCQRGRDDSGNAHLAVGDDARQSSDIPNTAVWSEETTKNAVDIHDYECRITAADTSCQRGTEDSGNTLLTVDDDARQSSDATNTAVQSDNSPSQRKTDDCGTTQVAVDDDSRQSPGTPNMAVPDASANARLGSQKVVEIEDSDGDDECIASGALNGKEATGDIAAAADDVGPSSLSGFIGSLKRKWFPEVGNSFDGLNKALVDVSDTDDDSSSSTSSLEFVINKVQLPSNFLRSTCDKRRKT